MKTEIRVSYPAEFYPHYDDALYAAAGRISDFAGIGFGRRDHGWTCQSEIEAARIKRALKRLGMSPRLTTDDTAY